MRILLLISSLLAALALLPRPAALAQPERPEFVGHVHGVQGFLLLFEHESDDWMRVEKSSDLNSWSELVNIVATNRTAFFVDDGVPLAPRRFYRIRIPGTTVEEARNRWQAQRISRYSVRLICLPPGLEATVTVADGQKTVSDVEQAGEPVDEFDPDDFPSIEEQFDLLEEAAAQGVRQAWAQYDQEKGYPVRIMISRPALEGGTLWYKISELDVLPEEDGY